MLSQTDRRRCREHGEAKQVVAETDDKVTENVEKFGKSLGASPEEIDEILADLGYAPRQRV